GARLPGFRPCSSRAAAPLPLDAEAFVALAEAGGRGTGRVPGSLDEPRFAVAAHLDEGGGAGAVAAQAPVVAVGRDEGRREITFARDADTRIGQQVLGWNVAV